MKKYSAFFLFVVLTTTAFSQRTLVHCGNLIDGKNKEVLSQMTIVVEGNKIVSLDKGFTKPGKEDKLIDLSKKTVMPGLIDMHVHIESETSKDALVKRFTQNEADIAFQSTIYARKTLMAGFTTVRDCGGSGVNLSLRNAINQGTIVGPRIFTAGKGVATTGGHGDPTNGNRKDLMGDPGPKEGVINGTEDAYKAVRQRYKDGADFIKITATGGVLSVAKDGSGPQFTQEEVNAIVAAAKDYGFHTAAHAHGAEGMKRAVLAGITTIEHGTLMTEEVMELMKQNGTYHVPTIIAGRSAAEYAKIPGYYHPLVVPKALEIGSKIQENFGKVYKIGSIEAGKIADVVAVNENPTSNIKTMEKVTFVMKEGVVYKNE